jgi:hypothetical protein
MNYEIKNNGKELLNKKQYECKDFQSVLVEVEGNVLDHTQNKWVNHNITPEDLICLGSNGQCYEWF